MNEQKYIKSGKYANIYKYIQLDNNSTPINNDEILAAAKESESSFINKMMKY